MEPLLGEIRPFPFNFAPRGWAYCDGSVLPISQNAALFSLLGTTYGGDGQNTFALPDLRGRVPVGLGPQSSLGEEGGVESVTLLANQLPAHTHALAVSGTGSSASPVGNHPGLSSASAPVYGTATGTLAVDSVAPTGVGGSHSNLQPSLAIGFFLAVEGIYPTQN